MRSHPVPKFQAKILAVIFVPLQPYAASAAKGAQQNVDRSIQNICCEPSFGSAKAEFVGWALGREFMVTFPILMAVPPQLDSGPAEPMYPVPAPSSGTRHLQEGRNLKTGFVMTEISRSCSRCCW